MSRSFLSRALLLCAAFCLVGALACSRTSPLEPQAAGPSLATPEEQVASAVQRPLGDFLDAQGTSAIFIPPLPDFIGWTNNNPQTLFVSVDYAGLVASYLESHGGPSLGTHMAGSVTERPLADGRAEVSVVLHTDDALTWAIPLPATDLATDPLVFGYRGTDLLVDPSLEPALSNSQLEVVFKNTAPGAALPDLVDAFILGNAQPGQELVKLMFRSQGAGSLRAPFGVADGTPGRCMVVNTGILQTPFKGAVADGFPAEHVHLQVVGGGGKSMAASD